MTKRIIALCGFIGSGKDTVGSILSQNYDYKQMSFAGKVKDLVAVAYGWERHMMTGDTLKSRKWREQPDPFWSKEYGYDFTPRMAMQIIGTECFRNTVNVNHWVASLKQDILVSSNDIVVTDVRFMNEMNMLRSIGAEIWRIDRGPKPEWYSCALSDNQHGSTLMNNYDVHMSEWNWVQPESEFDAIVDNNSTIEALYTQINQIITCKL